MKLARRGFILKITYVRVSVEMSYEIKELYRILLKTTWAALMRKKRWMLIHKTLPGSADLQLKNIFRLQNIALSHPKKTEKPWNYHLAFYHYFWIFCILEIMRISCIKHNTTQVANVNSHLSQDEPGHVKLQGEDAAHSDISSDRRV